MAMMAEKVCENVSIPAFKYVAEDVPVFREVGETMAHHSEVSPLISYRNDWLRWVGLLWS